MKAWSQFTEIYRPIIYRMACNRGLQDADAQDLAQQVLFSISQSIDRWVQNDDKSVRFRHWLRKVARNAILNALTRRPKDGAVGGTKIQIALEAQPESNERFGRELELEHQREVFFHATQLLKQELSTDAWQIFELTVVEGRPTEKVAELVNKSIAATYAARGRAMARIRQIVSRLQQEW